jgi:hypothetical protein
MPTAFSPTSGETYKFIRPAATGRSGIINLSLRLFTLFYGFDSNWASKPAPNDLTVIYLLDGKPISGQLKWPYAATYDTGELADGYHSLAVILVDSINPWQYRVLSRAVKFHNGKAAMSHVPTHGFPNRGSNLFSITADWLPLPAARPAQAPMPFPVVTAPPASKSGDPAKYRSAANWIVEPLCQTTSELYQATPSWYRDDDGDPYIGMYYPQTQPELEPAMARLWRADFIDGARNNNSISPYSTFAYDWNSPDIYGVDLIGRFFRIKPDGSVETLFGPRGDPAAIPYKDDEGFYTEFAGEVSDGSSPDLMCAIDLCQHRTLPHIWYLADMDRERIVEIDVSGPVAKLGTYVTGIHWSAAFYVCPDNSMVVAEIGMTHHGHTMPPGISIVAPDKTIRRLDLSGSKLMSPFCVRPTSDWKIICCDRQNNHIYEIDPDTSAARLIADPGKLGPATRISATSEQWTWLAVDRTGAIGPVDDIVVVQYSGKVNINNYRIGRRDLITAALRPFWTSSGGYCRVGAAQYCHDQMGHYPWAVALSERECRILFYGGGGDGVLSFRGRVASDPPAAFDLTAFNLGRGVFIRGTVAGFPHGMRPTFTALLNQQGQGRTGVPTFDEIAAWDDAKLTAWIQAGMGGDRARPEIVGHPLACLIYYIRKNSTQGLLRPIPPPRKPADTLAPLLGSVKATPDGTVTWTTNEPALGYVAFGSSSNYHRWSEPEAAFSTSHQCKMEHMSTPCHYSVRCVDLAGNVAAGSSLLL